MLNQENCLAKTDEELALEALKDKESYRYLMAKYEPKLMRYVIRLSGVRGEDAEDILQNVFIKAYQSLNDFDPHLKFSSWIYRIAHNETISYIRKLKTRPQAVNVEDNQLLMDSMISEMDLAKELDNKYLSENVSQLISRLHKKYQEVIILKYIEDKSYEEISDILRKPMGTVATLIKRAKTKLKKELLTHYIN